MTARFSATAALSAACWAGLEGVMSMSCSPVTVYAATTPPSCHIAEGGQRTGTPSSGLRACRRWTSTPVAEAFVDAAWRVVDATCVAPRQTLVRIATGRDAADTTFLDNHKSAIALNNMTVTATSDGDLPKDSVDQLVSIQ